VLKRFSLLKNFSSLLFELSSVDRLDILFLLRRTPMKLSHVSKKLDFTVQETSRNITRLSEAKMIIKDVDGLYCLTPYGEESLNLLSGFFSRIGITSQARAELTSYPDAPRLVAGIEF
jgi:predicted transcriptional regulator